MAFVSCSGCKRYYKTPGTCPNPTCPNLSAAPAAQGPALPAKPVAGATAPKLPSPVTAPKLPAPGPSAPPQLLVVPSGGAAFPASLSYAFRGEDDAKGGKPGRNPAAVRTAGGFRCWKYPARESGPGLARQNLADLAAAGTLEDEARMWCVSKNRENGFFFSTATAVGAAYDNYDYLYRIDVSGLRKRDWGTVGLTSVKSVDKMVLYTDQPTVAGSSVIALFWNSPHRTQELLIMTPIPTTSIELKKKGGSTYGALATAT